MSVGNRVSSSTVFNLAYCSPLTCFVFVTSPPGAAFGWNMLLLSKDVRNRLCHVGRAEALKGDRHKQQMRQFIGY